VKEDGKWVTLKVKVVQIWDNTSDKITQTGLIGDETGIIKFTIWESANLPPMEEGRSYEIKRCPECNRKPFLQQKSFISL
jgi:replication factor A1